MLDAEREFQSKVQEDLLEADGVDGGPRIAEISTFEEAGIMTMNAGLVVRMDNGNEFQVTIVQSVFAEDDDEDGDFR